MNWAAMAFPCYRRPERGATPEVQERRTLGGVSTELFEALRAADPHAPRELAVFDAVVATGEMPDFFEYSVRVGDRMSPYRFTYYFDTHRRGAGVAREAGERFCRLGGELGLALPSSLSAFVRSEVPASPEVLQVVLGAEVPSDGSPHRGKYYLVFRDNPGPNVLDLLGSLGLVPLSGADPEKVYILGVDVTAAGVDDVKLYFRLESRRVPALLDELGDVGELLAESREVVFQQCMRRPERRQMYLHARSTALLSGWLGEHGFDEALDRARSINRHLQRSRIDPWIVSFAYAQRRLDLRSANVYFHLGRGR